MRRNEDEKEDREGIELGPAGGIGPDRSAGGRSDVCCVRCLVGSRPGTAQIQQGIKISFYFVLKIFSKS